MHDQSHNSFARPTTCLRNWSSQAGAVHLKLIKTRTPLGGITDAIVDMLDFRLAALSDPLSQCQNKQGGLRAASIDAASTACGDSRLAKLGVCHLTAVMTAVRNEIVLFQTQLDGAADIRRLQPQPLRK